MKTQTINSAKKGIITFMIILSGCVLNNANAQGFTGLVAMLSPVNAMNRTNVEKMAVMINEELNDNDLKVEDWMSNDNYWNVKEQDKQLNVEDWMSNENYWGVNQEANVTDNPLTVESWMSSETYWTGNQQEKDQSLAIEDWMASNTYWGVK
jgi:hypothetical protein